MHPNNKLTVNAVEAAPLEDFSLEVRPIYTRTPAPYAYAVYGRPYARVLQRLKGLLMETGLKKTSWRPV